VTRKTRMGYGILMSMSWGSVAYRVPGYSESVNLRFVREGQLSRLSGHLRSRDVLQHPDYLCLFLLALLASPSTLCFPPPSSHDRHLSIRSQISLLTAPQSLRPKTRGSPTSHRLASKHKDRYQLSTHHSRPLANRPSA